MVILAVVLLCGIAAIGGAALAVGTDAIKQLAGLSSEAPDKHADDTEGADAAEGADHAEAGTAKAAPDAVADLPVMPFPEIIVNVTETGTTGRQSSRFLKLNMLMVYDDKIAGADRLLSREVYIRDTFQDFLRQLLVSDLKGSQGLAMIKTELLRRARAVGDTDAPVEILIADMVVQ